MNASATTTSSRRAGRRAALVVAATRPHGGLARESGLHPDLVGRLVRLGLVEPSGGTPSAPHFPPDAAARLARAARLRRDLGLNFAGPCSCPSSSTGSTSSSSGRPLQPDQTRGDAMDPNRLTQKSQEALATAQAEAARRGHAETDSSTCCWRCSRIPRRSSRAS